MDLQWIIGAVGAVIAAIAGAFFMGGRGAKNKHDAQDARRALDAETARRKLDDEIASDTDLAARARRAGIVRPKRK